ncbi:hypothetical protein LF41_2694 [Lysobacter dokdonensis DS-58]|uniref:Uncharacterized protein n=1 Tax=Lysobacter dokdonensis DS-58 TaxID=1300345 RepID=A0A0A2WHU5_9GAMM|nr:hypothetical protein LF41_2694 [Lysobacter dokdonensis DS-58]
MSPRTGVEPAGPSHPRMSSPVHRTGAAAVRPLTSLKSFGRGHGCASGRLHPRPPRPITETMTRTARRVDSPPGNVRGRSRAIPSLAFPQPEIP